MQQKSTQNMTEWWFSSEKMTVWVKTGKHGIIIDGAPIIKKFSGQPLENLERWMKRQGGFKKEKLNV